MNGKNFRRKAALPVLTTPESTLKFTEYDYSAVTTGDGAHRSANPYEFCDQRDVTVAAAMSSACDVINKMDHVTDDVW